ncbi:envelope stress response protein PspG [Plesiomonas shigelloides]|uniref:envelope stress response protein PspG n=1 Tax=Plesiomonas shigelloides TaxID=703 RepID=UPI0012621384|nr:envelope stress response protein PspG [Plesiomonas shigelloides]KAB7666199.1 envelope stress response protein PspG [Plesiomonas shigelloides]
MLELLFVLGFFVVLLATGLSVLGALLALLAGFALMLLGGMLALALKLLPWLLLAVVVVWLLRSKAPASQSYFRRR